MSFLGRTTLLDGVEGKTSDQVLISWESKVAQPMPRFPKKSPALLRDYELPLSLNKALLLGGGGGVLRGVPLDVSKLFKLGGG